MMRRGVVDDTMSQIGEGDEESMENAAFLAVLDSSKQFIQLLKSLTFKEKANFFISHHGLKVMVQDSKCLQLSAYFMEAFFLEYYLKKNGEESRQVDEEGEGDNDREGEGELSFNINLSSVIHCMELLGDNSTSRLKLSYAGYGYPLKLLLDDQDATMKCEIKTMDVEDCADFNFAKSTVLAKVILNSEMFKDIASSIPGVSDEVTLKITDDSIKFCVSSIFGDMENEISSRSEMVEKFECQAPITAKYSLNLIRQGLKPINFSQKLSFRVDARDLLCIQHMIQLEGEWGDAFTEMYCVPIVPMEE